MSFTARRQPSGETDIPDRGFADTLSGFVKHKRSNPILMPPTPCLLHKPENCCCYGHVSKFWTLKTPVFMARKHWCHDVTMSSENSQGYLWIPCKFYSSLSNQIMCNKQSALENVIRWHISCVTKWMFFEIEKITNFLELIRVNRLMWFNELPLSFEMCIQWRNQLFFPLPTL